MVVCASCGSHNNVSNAYCEDCGNLLHEHFSEAADGLQGLSSDVSLRLLFIFPRNSVSVPFPEGSALTLGRQAKNATQSFMSRVAAVENSMYYAALKGSAVNLSKPVGFLSLVPFGGTIAGVSRTHAVIRREEGFLTIEDLGSSNGTQINGQRLIPGDKVLLQHISELRLGYLELTLRLSLDTLAL